jgi:small subunit ribosomal protein S2e
MEQNRGGFGGGKGKGKGKGKGNAKTEEEWKPITKLGRLVKAGKITTFEEIFLAGVPIMEVEIVDQIAKAKGIELKDDVMKIHPVQRMTAAGQRNRFVAYVIVGDCAGHIGLGHKCAKEVASAIKGAMVNAKVNLMPVRRGFWGNKFGVHHTVPMKVSGSCGSVTVRLIPAPRGAGVIGSPTLKKMLAFAGIPDCYSSTTGHTKTKGNFMKATFQALQRTQTFLTPDLWDANPLPEDAQSPFEKFSTELKSLSAEKIEA